MKKENIAKRNNAIYFYIKLKEKLHMEGVIFTLMRKNSDEEDPSSRFHNPHVIWENTQRLVLHEEERRD